VPGPQHPLPPAGPPDDSGQGWLAHPDGVYELDPEEHATDRDDDWEPDDLLEECFPASGPAGAGPVPDLPLAPQAAFTLGGPADLMPPGLGLAALAGEVRQAGPERLDDDQLTGLLQAAQRLGAWAAELKLSAISELATRRATEARASGDWRLTEHVNDEVAIALTLTRAALAAGAIDERRAAVLVDELSGLDDEDAAAAEARLIGKAPQQTTAQLRAAARGPGHRPSRRQTPQG
jgi:hypothetical protein